MNYYTFLSKKNEKRNKRRVKGEEIKPYYTDIENTDYHEVGIDEVGRGPLFGRVYVACVILPKGDSSFQYSLLKDSKRFSSEKKLLKVYEYIKKRALSYSVHYEDETTIDTHNILETTLRAMHKCLMKLSIEPNFILVDGDKFRPYKDIPYQCIEGGDDWYASIAAASILAKVERDQYIYKLCIENPYLKVYYKIDKNKGYGTRDHLEGIRTHGISPWHRKSFGICKTTPLHE